MRRLHYAPRILVLIAAGWLPALLCGCKEEEPERTLRQAEGIAYAWLENTDKLLNPPPVVDEEGPKKKEKRKKKGAKTLRDCFVNDGWNPEGFKNPTEAIAWLTEDKRTLGKVASIEKIDGEAEVTFELKGKEAVSLVARVVIERGLPKCNTLKKVG